MREIKEETNMKMMEVSACVWGRDRVRKKQSMWSWNLMIHYICWTNTESIEHEYKTNQSSIKKGITMNWFGYTDTQN